MRKHLYTGLLIITGVFLVMIFVFSKKNKGIAPSFKERQGTIALSAEWLNTRQAIKDLLDVIEINPQDYKAKLNLAQAYIQEARITGDHAYYDQSALDLLDDVIAAEPGNFDAICCKATVLLSQHHFAEGLEVAQQGMKMNPNNAFIYGLMCDAYVELGNYQEAVKMSDKMISIRPDLRSYSRISYLREIHGQTKGAVEAAKLAVSSGYPGLEQTEWARMILAHLYESTGELDSAEIQFKIALQERPDYAYAIAGLGKVAKARGNYKEAIVYFEKAKRLIIDYSFADELTDLYRLNKEDQKAEKSAQEVIEMLSPVSNADEGATAHGHYADRELAYAYLKINNVSKALEHAGIEYLRRPMNIDACETLAWTKFKNGETEAANKLMTIALRTNSNNPVLLCRAGLIKMKSGESVAGKKLLKRALETNPFLENSLKLEAIKYTAN
jgi:tetratricopeptide (TPR) repeat protein